MIAVDRRKASTRNNLDEDLVDVLSEVLKVPYERAKEILNSRSVRVMKYKKLRYIALRRDLEGLLEGTSIVLTPRGDVRVIDGYPPIRRILLLEVSVPKHFIDDIVVEEKLDGYNVRIAEINGEIYAFTRGGLICPYTTLKIRKTYTQQIEKALNIVGGDSIIVGEAVGLENPYVRHYYPEAPTWDFFVFDIYKPGLAMLPIAERVSVVRESGLRGVPQLGVYNKDDVDSIKSVVEGLEELGREGIVLKDPYYRVEPLKYTTSSANVNDLELGMRFPFDEGRTFIFPRVLRQIFKAFEEKWDRAKLEEEARRLGLALLAPALETLRGVHIGGAPHEEFTLTLDSLEDLEEFITHFSSLGIPVSVTSIDYDGRSYKVRVVKSKKTIDEFKRILKTGLSPLD